MNRLPNLETCTITYTDHTLQKDIITIGQPWILEPLSEENSLNPKLSDSYKVQTIRDSMSARKFEWTFHRATLRDGVELKLMGIGGRQREYFPPDRELRPPPLPASYYDWFG